MNQQQHKPQMQSQSQSQQPQSQQWRCAAELLSIAQCLGTTQNQDRTLRVKAEKELENQARNNGFGVKLLQIVDDKNIPDTVKFCSAIYFKNYIKKYWACEENLINSSDRSLIKEHLIRVMLGASLQCQKQFSETISTIANHDFMEENWENLKPAPDGTLAEEWSLLKMLVTRLDPSKSNMSQIEVVLGIIRSITSIHVGEEKNHKMVVQIKYILKQFIVPFWLQMLQMWSKVATQDFHRGLTSPPNIIDKHNHKNLIQCLDKLVLIFYDLASVDLIEYFQDTMKEWSQIFLNALLINDNFQVFGKDNEIAGPIDRLQTAVIKSAALFAQRYEEESQQYLSPFVDTCIQLLATLDEKERYDTLVAETTNYLQVVARQQWNRSLFDQNKLNQIVSSILIRNIKLRATDVNMFEVSGEEWVLRDMEGSDFCTRRRGALELLRKLCEVWPQEISVIVQSHVTKLLEDYNKNPKQNYVSFDTAVNLFLATNVMGETKADGATKLLNTNSLAVVQNFLNANIMPYLSNKTESPHPLVSAACLKYTIMFRSQYPQAMFEQLLSLACTFLSNEDFVNHTYAAIALDRVLSMKVAKNTSNNSNSNSNDDNKQSNDDFNRANGIIVHGSQYKYPKEEITKNLRQILLPLFRVLTTYEDSSENEYVMKAIMKVIVRVEEDVGQVIKSILEQMIQIIQKISKNPSKPTFNHYMFEIVAACIHYTCKSNPSSVQHFESFLMADFKTILSNDVCAEFHPYVFQIISLMLRIRGSVTDSYVEIYDAMLKTDQWTSDGNILAISSMFGDFYKILAKNDEHFEKFMTPTRLQGTLGIYQHLLCRRTQDIYAFRILSALFEYCPIAMLNNYMKPILELIFSRLKAQKTNTLCAQFIKSLAIIVIKHGFQKLYDYCEKTQTGIFTMILMNVWLPFCRHILNLVDRLIVTHAMILILKSPVFLENQALQSSTNNLIETIIDVFERAPLEDKELKSYERRIQSLEDQGAGATFSTLIFAKPPAHNISNQLGDPRKALVQTMAQLSQQQPQFKVWIEGNLKSQYSTAFNGYAGKFDTQFRLSVGN